MQSTRIKGLKNVKWQIQMLGTSSRSKNEKRTGPRREIVNFQVDFGLFAFRVGKMEGCVLI